MGLRFRRSVKILPGVRVNISSRGTSLSVGGRGATTNISRRGVRSTVGIPGTGLSYTTRTSRWNNNSRRNAIANNQHFVRENNYRSVSLLLALGILFLPFIFAWFTLREGYSPKVRILSFLWLTGVILTKILG